MEFILVLVIILVMLLVMSVIYIICATPGLIVSAVIIRLIKKKLTINDKKFKIVIYAMIVLFCGNISTKIVAPVLLAESEKPDELYIEMKAMDDSQRLIGLRKDQVVILLGETAEISKYSNTYTYGAGNIYVGLMGGNFFKKRKNYIFEITFDETDIVKSTSIKQST